MNFWIGLLLGIGLSLAVRGMMAEYAPSSGVEKPEEPCCPSDRKTWAQTRNFLYYDGTVMPEIKEDAHEH